MELETLVKAYNVDRTKNKRGMIKSYVNLKFLENRRSFLDSHGLRNTIWKSIGKLANLNGKLKPI